jgi:rSAM/selenodomain-associated transferase 1
MSAPAAVALFARVPVPGRVKSRLAAAIGDHDACRLYRAMVADILVQIGGSGLLLWLFYDDGAVADLPVDWTGGAAEIRRQADGDIGTRMAAAFADCFAAGIGRVVLVGSDIPAIDSHVLLSALSALDTHDAVFAPTVDGGYGLIGLRQDRFRRQIFHDIPWSTGMEMATTLQRCRQCGLEPHLLPTLQDIDTVADLEKYAIQPSRHAIRTNSVVAGLMAGQEKEPVTKQKNSK